jgi:hypothetical protein
VITISAPFAGAGLDSGLMDIAQRLSKGRLSRHPWDMTILQHSDVLFIVDDRLISNKQYTPGARPRCGYVQIERTDRGEKQYRVWAPDIQNDKYKASDSKYHTKTSQSADKIVDIANEYVKPHPWHDIVGTFLNRGKVAHLKWQKEAENAYSSALGFQPLHEEIMQALAMEVKNGAVFATNIMQAYTALPVLDAFQEHQARKTPATYSYAVFYNGHDEQTKTFGVYGVNNDYSTIAVNKQPDDVVADSAMAQVAMLKMAAPDTFVPRVGYRASDYIYYVY